MDNNKTETKGRTRSTRVKTAKKTEQRSDEVIASLEVQTKGVVSNISMLYNTIRELKDRGEFKKIERMNAAQEENFARLDALDAELGARMRKKYQTNNRGVVASRSTSTEEQETTAITESHNEIDKTDEMLAMFQQTVEEEAEEERKVEVNTFENLEDIDEIYDVLGLPSNGQCYPHKKNKIAVSYLTAMDENFITSPNLYRDGLITDCLLQRKIVDKTFDINNLCAGDADAVLFFLRVSSYGADFPATFTDPDTGQQFETVIDLNQIKVKDFNLVGDENGYFDFELPVSKDKIKFRFLTKRDERKLERMNELGDNSVKAVAIRNIADYLNSLVEDSNEFFVNNEDEEELYVVQDAVDVLHNVSSRMEAKEGLPVNKLITNRLEMNVVSVNGNSDKAYVRKYVRNMIARDSLALRRYILENTPGLDFSIKIEKPESLGGGSINTFLEWNDTVFLSIS